VFVRVSITRLSAGTTYTFTVYTEIDDVIMSGVDVTVKMLPNAGPLFTYWKVLPLQNVVKTIRRILIISIIIIGLVIINTIIQGATRSQQR